MLDGYIDLPAEGSTVVGGSMGVVSGWVVDRTAQGWSGIDQVHLLAIAPDERGYDLGTGILQQNRPDVAVALGNPFFVTAGFVFPQVRWDLPAGPYTLYVRAHTPDKGWWLRSSSIVVSERPPPTPTPRTTAAPMPTSAPRDPSWASRCTQAALNYLSPIYPYISGDSAASALVGAAGLCNAAAEANGERGVRCFEQAVDRWQVLNSSYDDFNPPVTEFLNEVLSCIS